jgi:hypothetical protein
MGFLAPSAFLNRLCHFALLALLLIRPSVSSLVRGSEMRVAELCSWLAIGITWNCPSRVRCKNLVEVQFLRTTISAALVDL